MSFHYIRKLFYNIFLHQSIVPSTVMLTTGLFSVIDPPDPLLVTEMEYLSFGKRPLTVKFIVELSQLQRENVSLELVKDMLYGEQLLSGEVNVQESRMEVRLRAATCTSVKLT